MRLGYELGYAENLTRPTDLRNPDKSQSKPMKKIERLYIRVFGLPDTVKQQQAREVFSILDKLSFSSVLDIGCARGHYSIRIARKYPNSKVKGIDINEKQLNVGLLVKKKFGLNNLTFEKRDICASLIEEKYELVLLLQVIEHLKDDRLVLKEIRNMINDNGHLIITAPNLESAVIKKLKRYVKVAGHYRDGYTLEDLVNLVRVSNFRIKQIKYLSGTIGGLIEKLETYLKINNILLFSLLYPFLNYLALLDDHFKANKCNTRTSGILIVATTG